jgi:hypothetical protein
LAFASGYFSLFAINDEKSTWERSGYGLETSSPWLAEERLAVRLHMRYSNRKRTNQSATNEKPETPDRVVSSVIVRSIAGIVGKLGGIPARGGVGNSEYVLAV